MSDEWLPLFPLQVVLFPGMSLPLHIFEPRYRLMVRTCLERKGEFGVVLARKKSFAEVGCSAEIAEITRKFPDGRFNILTLGRRRFRIRELSDELAYQQAEVEFFTGETESKPSPEEVAKLLPLFREAYRFSTGDAEEPERPPEFSDLSYFIAATLPFDLETRQEILETEPETARLRLVEERLRDWLPRLRRISRLRARAAGNGHG